jgi:hypothetical protein
MEVPEEKKEKTDILRPLRTLFQKNYVKSISDTHE